MCEERGNLPPTPYKVNERACLRRILIYGPTKAEARASCRAPWSRACRCFTKLAHHAASVGPEVLMPVWVEPGRVTDPAPHASTVGGLNDALLRNVNKLAAATDSLDQERFGRRYRLGAPPSPQTGSEARPRGRLRPIPREFNPFPTRPASEGRKFTLFLEDDLVGCPRMRDRGPGQALAPPE
jgi:hypothetical protein